MWKRLQSKDKHCKGVSSLANGTIADRRILIFIASTVVLTIANLADWDAECSLTIRTTVKLCHTVT